MIPIVGAGLAGLSAAYHLDDKYILLEKKSHVGGLCQSVNIDGYVFDYGPHILYTKDKYAQSYIRKMLGDNLSSHQRRAFIFKANKFIKYPFEMNLHPLSAEIIEECIQGIINKKDFIPNNFKEWILSTFGEGISKHYMIPYNEKVWKYPLENMNLDWIKGRVPSPTLDDVQKGAHNIHSDEHGPNAEFWYPKEDGIGSLATNIATNVSVSYNSEVTRIQKEDTDIIATYVQNGIAKTITSDSIVSSIPLPELIKLIDNVPSSIKNVANQLVYNSLIVVMIGVDRPNLIDKHWLYFPEDKYIFNRISFPMNFSPLTTPKNKSSILVEITYRNKKYDLESIKKRVLNDLLLTGILQTDDKIEVCNAMDFKYAYVIYDIAHNTNVRLVHDFLRENSIIPIGRFGEWEYFNMDKAILSGKKMATQYNMQN